MGPGCIRCLLGAVLLAFAPGFALADGNRASGSVHSATTGEPLGGAALTLRSLGENHRLSRTAVTDSAGGFAFVGLPAGPYELTIGKPGYRGVIGDAGRFEVRDGEETGGLAFLLRPKASISGRIVDWVDEPVAEAEVRAYVLAFEAGSVRLVLAATADTDDRGAYRLIDLPAGKFVIQASPPRGDSPAARFYANTPAAYFPGVPTPAQALPVSVSWGQELSSIDLALPNIAGFTAGGLVSDAATGGPCGRCTVRVFQREGNFLAELPNPAQVAPDGVFGISGLPNGEYTLIAHRRGSGGFPAAANVAVNGRHVADARLVTGIRRSVRGVIALENPPDGIDPTAWTPRLISPGFAPFWPEADGRVEDDRSFESSDLPPATYDLVLDGLPPGAYVRETRSGSQPAAGGEVVVPADGPAPDVRVLVAFDAATLTGRIAGAGATPGGTAGARVHLLPDANSTPYAVQRTHRTQADGSFVFDSVVPGEYTVYALPAGSDAQINDPEVQAALRRQARSITLKQNETASTELQLVEFGAAANY